MENYNFNENEIKLLIDFNFPNVPLIINNYANEQTVIHKNELNRIFLNEESKLHHKIAFDFQVDRY